jgi:FkbM family methyltransferase
MDLNLSGIPVDTWYGRALRFPLRLIPKGLVMPVLQGPLKGYLWVVGSSNHGCWLGSYEYTKARAFASRCRPGMVVWDIGAHAGYYAMIAARRVGPSGKVVAVEPFPPNLALLHRHLVLNKVQNVIVVDGALSDQDGTGFLREGRSTSQCFLDSSGIPTSCFCLDTMVFRKALPPPQVMKIDVEGSEAAVLRGGLAVLRTFRPVIFLAVHSEMLLQKCESLLLGVNYRLSNLDVFELVAEP